MTNNKHYGLTLLILLFSVLPNLMAQTDSATVTFSIDLSQITHPAGNFVVNVTGEFDNWTGWGLTLGDSDNDSVYTGATKIAVGTYEYIFTITGDFDGWSGWGIQGHPPLGASCDYDPTDEYANYGLVVTTNDTTLATVCWESCAACAEAYSVTFAVDVTQFSGLPAGSYTVNVTGEFDNWSGWGADLQDADTDGIWVGSANLAPGDTSEYIFTITGDFDGWSGWGIQGHPPLGASCDYDPTDEFANYGVVVTTHDIATDTVCWEACEPCTEEISLLLNGFETADDIAVGEGFFWSEYEETESVDNYVTNSLVTTGMYDGAAAMQTLWSVAHDFTWGGYVALEHLADSLIDLTEYNYISFWYYNYQPSDVDSTMALRFSLYDASNEPTPANWGKTTCEYWYSFIEDPIPFDAVPGWVNIKIPLKDAGGTTPVDYSNGFVRTGWAGIAGNGTLDLDSLAGFAIEIVNGGSMTENGDAVSGAIWFDKLEAVWSDEVEGCTDSEALNYDEDATVDDGSCLYPEDYVSVTFMVNMEQQTVDSTGVYIAGGTIGEVGFLMDDSDNDGVWTYTWDVLKNTDVIFKFRNGPGDGNWGGNWEETAGLIDGGCNYGDYDDRIFHVGEVDTTLFTCFGQCSTDGTCEILDESYVTFNVDMNCVDFTFTTVYVTGPWAGWSGTAYPLDDTDGDGIWSATYPFALNFEYKYEVDDWANQEDLVDDMQAGGSCAPVTDYYSYANRQVILTGDTTTTDTYGQCDACIAVHDVDVEFAVNMNYEAGFNSASDTPYIFGTFNEWDYASPILMSDADQDGIYTGVVTLLSRGTVDYLFGYGSGYEDMSNTECGRMDETLGITVRRMLTPVDSATNFVTDTVDYGACTYTVSVDGEDSILPTEFALAAYPNPFNPDLTVYYELPRQEEIRVSIYNLLGQEVVTLVNREHTAGRFSVVWNGRNARGAVANTGIYFVVVKHAAGVSVQKVTLLK